MVWISVGALVIQIIIAVVSYFTIYRHRVIYGIKTEVLRMPKGTKDDIDANLDHINNQLTCGKYTILQFAKRIDSDLEVVLGRIKK
ncbi:MAG: hypothetical protein ISS55_07610 [Dehalococcoidales bacterium]|nr:hypothetical protein [Dehalococcoidales bacterium]